MAENSKKPKQKFTSIVKNSAKMLGKIAKYTPEYFVFAIVCGLVWGLFDSAVTLFNYNLLNTVNDGGEFIAAAKLIGVMAIFYILNRLYDKWYWCIKNPLMKKKLHLRMHEELFKKSLSIDLSCFDDPEFYNDFVWAMNESDKRAISLVEDLRQIIQRFVASFAMFGILFSVDWVVAAILFVSSAIATVCNIIGNKIGYVHNKEGMPLWRERWYINRVHHLADYAKELRANRAGELLLAEYDELTKKRVKLERKYGKRYFLVYNLGSEVAGHITFFAVTVYMIYLLGTGSLSVGAFAASVGVIWNLRWQFADLIQKFTRFPQHSLYIEKYFEFINFEPQIKGGKTDIPEFESLEFKNVTFSYQFSAHPKYRFHEADHKPKISEDAGKNVLKNVNLKFKKGDKIAFVGYNGAGKTTLIKLIMRLYDPTEGEILYNGVNIKEYEPRAYRKMIGTVFQDYKIFAASIAENVMNGGYSSEDEQTVMRALGAANFTDKLKTLKGGIETHLTKEFDEGGTNLSGGEAQKIAISRVFSKDYPIVIMDEPSSALDPLAEYNLNQSILHSTGDKTVIFISHRLSTTRIADRIYMFDRGDLIEEGNHTELLELSGKYAEMFKLQSEKYLAEGITDSPKKHDGVCAAADA